MIVGCVCFISIAGHPFIIFLFSRVTVRRKISDYGGGQCGGFLKQINFVTGIAGVRLYTVGEKSPIHQIIAEPEPGAFECFHVVASFLQSAERLLPPYKWRKTG